MLKKNLRSCIGCRKKTKKEELLRVSVNKDKIISFDKDGRGAYLCFSEGCFQKAINRKKNAFSFNLKAKVSKEFLEQIRAKI